MFGKQGRTCSWSWVREWQGGQPGPIMECQGLRWRLRFCPSGKPLDGDFCSVRDVRLALGFYPAYQAVVVLLQGRPGLGAGGREPRSRQMPGK